MNDIPDTEKYGKITKNNESKMVLSRKHEGIASRQKTERFK